MKLFQLCGLAAATPQAPNSSLLVLIVMPMATAPARLPPVQQRAALQ
ncbi:hypothetical protein [Pyrobaculum sp.]